MGRSLRRVPAVGHRAEPAPSRPASARAVDAVAPTARPRRPTDHRRSTTDDASPAARAASASSTACSAAASCRARRSCSPASPASASRRCCSRSPRRPRRSGRRVLYASAEESAGQVRLRAERTGALHDDLYLASETDLAHDPRPHRRGQAAAADRRLGADRVVVARSTGSPGSPSQVREVAATLIRVAKDRDLPVLIVGHVTKDGSIAGPRLLEHLVDVVCHFEGDRQTALRFVRALKNRFGPTDEVGCFEMTGDGIAEVPDPSGLFLGRGPHPSRGTCVTIALEGRRALPVEVQALIVPSDGAEPAPRRATASTPSRVAMVLAVLERRAGIKTRRPRRLRLHRRRRAAHRARRRPRDRDRRRRVGRSRPPCPHDRGRVRRAQPRRRDPSGHQGAQRRVRGGTPRFTTGRRRRSKTLTRRARFFFFFFLTSRIRAFSTHESTPSSRARPSLSRAFGSPAPRARYPPPPPSATAEVPARS